tara:strand:- start:196 stop:1725 length:1530 start_codon:yes stop_codon:yes gene_type:complete
MLFSQDIDNNLEKNVNFERGNIYDHNGIILATSIDSISLSVNPTKIKDIKLLSNKLSKILQVDSYQLEKKLNSQKNFVWVKRNITPIEYQKIVNLGEINLQTHKEQKRIYPYKNSASHLVGYVDVDLNGQSGIERFFNNELKISKDIYLSIDINLQQSVRKNLVSTISKYDAESGLAIIMDISNGNILSSVSLPDFNPENKDEYSKENLINRVFQSNYEMGSTFKPITATMGFDLDIIKPEMKFDVKKNFKGISDHDKYKNDGIYDVEKIIVESSNIGSAQIATLIGKKNQKKFFDKLGFNKRINIENNEAAKPLGNKNNWGPIETATIGFGHGFSITPLHLVKAYATLANNGYEVFPTLISEKEINIENKILHKIGSSQFFLNLLNSVVMKTDYTGPRVKIDGYNVGGKTGTSELLNPDGGYFKDRNLTSFIGVFPIDNPQYIIYTAIHYPKKEKGTNQRMTGARVNAPLVKNIIIDMIKLYNIPKLIINEYQKVDTKFTYKNINEVI